MTPPVNEPEIEVSVEVFERYLHEFNRPIERKRNEQRRHISTGDINDFALSDQLSGQIVDVAEQYITKAELDEVIKRCTPTQQKRFELHFIYGLTYLEIAQKQCVDVSSVRESVSAVTKKIKNIF